MIAVISAIAAYGADRDDITVLSSHGSARPYLHVTQITCPPLPAECVVHKGGVRLPDGMTSLELNDTHLITPGLFLGWKFEVSEAGLPTSYALHAPGVFMTPRQRRSDGPEIIPSSFEFTEASLTTPQVQEFRIVNRSQERGFYVDVGVPWFWFQMGSSSYWHGRFELVDPPAPDTLILPRSHPEYSDVTFSVAFHPTGTGQESKKGWVRFSPAEHPDGAQPGSTSDSSDWDSGVISVPWDLEGRLLASYSLTHEHLDRFDFTGVTQPETRRALLASLGPATLSPSYYESLFPVNPRWASQAFQLHCFDLGNADSGGDEPVHCYESLAAGNARRLEVRFDPTKLPPDLAAATLKLKFDGSPQPTPVVEQLLRSPTPLSGLAYIAPGSFQMGSETGEDGRDSGERQHAVNLTTGFLMQATEVTQGQWKALSGDVNPSHSSACGDACPVESVDWYSTLAYANALSASKGLQACYQLVGCADPADGWKDGVHEGCTDASFVGLDCTGYRLPTEAEWEYATRANSSEATYEGALSEGTLGDLFRCDMERPALDGIAWWCGNSAASTHPVAQKRPNAWGLYDVLGNVREWVWDRHGDYGSQSVTDPLGHHAAFLRVHRGGGWLSPPIWSRAAQRGAANPAWRFRDLGFRLCRTHHL